MKAYIYTKYGEPDVLCLEKIQKSEPKCNEVQVRIKALSINPAEWHKLTASFWMLRLSTGLFRPKHPVLGADVSGTVIATGKDIKNFKKGDKVFGRCLSGGLAEFCCLEETHAAKVPENISFQQAAALPLAAVTALIALRDKGQIKPNQKVLINGASGGIGTYAVQMAKYFKADITGICSAENVALVQSLGANKVIDYKIQDLESVSSQFDLIIDLVGNKKATTFTKLLKPRGKCVFVGMDSPKRLFSNMFQGMVISAFGSKEIFSMDAKVTSKDLAFVAQLTEEGKLRPIIDQIFNFKSIPEAFEYLSKRRSKGKIVIKL